MELSDRSQSLLLYAEWVDSVAQLSRAEEQAIRGWRALMSEMQDTVAPRCEVRLARVTGDGLLVSFGDARRAVAFAFALQEAGTRIGVQAGCSFGLRFGLHQGGFAEESGDLRGPGVWVALRVSGLAHPGWVVATAAACATLRDGVDAHIEDLGLHRLQRLDGELHLFRLGPPGGSAAERPPTLRPQGPPPLHDAAEVAPPGMADNPAHAVAVHQDARRGQ